MIKTENINYSNLAFFRFKKFKNGYLLTNEVGEYIILKPVEFKKFLEGSLDKNSSIYRELCKKNFIKDKLNFDNYIEKYRIKHNYLFQGPSLHIVVTTLRCNHRCIYCQASSKNLNEKNFDMSLSTAKKVVDFIFETPNQNLAIEFQGGEPLINWEVVKFITLYSREKNKQEKRNLELRLVSNFSLMDEEKIKFCFENNVSLCTSLDGPEKLHNKQRILIGGNSYRQTIKWLKYAIEIYKKYDRKQKKEKGYIFQPGALPTITKFSLKYPKEIVNEYLKFGIEVIFLRPVSPLGFAKNIWGKIGYEPEEFIKFYKNALDYILKLNLKGKKIYERMATIIVTKILKLKDPNYLELRSPCGAGIGQLAYDYDGTVYTCDEGRMLRQQGEDLFKLGNVFKNDYSSIIENPNLKAMCLASEINSHPECTHCVYDPYCGLCPIYNYFVEGNIFGKTPINYRCKIHKGIFDFIFERLTNSKIKKIFEKWAEKELTKGIGIERVK
jgi:His-Xaa-Ser system radical SAM maturase HxsB